MLRWRAGEIPPWGSIVGGSGKSRGEEKGVYMRACIRGYVFLSRAAAFLSLSVMALAAPCAHAQFTISPVLVELNVYPGGFETFQIAAGSSSTSTQDCTARLAAMEVAGSGLPVEVEDASRSCRDWISMDADTFVLKPKEGHSVRCTLRVPREAVGGYYAILVLEATPRDVDQVRDAEQGVAAAIRFRHRSLVPILLTVPGPNLHATIDVGKPIMSYGSGGTGYTLQVPLRNRGNMHARVLGSVEMRSEGGLTLERLELSSGRGFLLPGHERLLSNRGVINLTDGAYVAHVRFDVEGSKQPMQDSFSFYIVDGQPHVEQVTDEVRAKLSRQASGFIVTPSFVQVPLRPRGRRTAAVEIVNITNQPVRIAAKPAEWGRAPAGADLVTDEPAAHGRSAREFIQLPNAAVEVAPRSRARFPIVVTLPVAAAGEFYAAVCFDREDLDLDKSPESRMRRSALITIAAQGSAQSAASIQKFTALQNAKGAVEFTVEYNNTGNVNFAADLSVSVMDANNAILGRIRPSEPPPYVQAGGKGLICVNWTQVLDPGSYTGVLSLRFDQNKPALSARAAFEAGMLTQPAQSAAAPKETAEQP